MTKRTATHFLMTEIAAEGGKAPDWIMLFPKGPKIEARDGRRFTINDPAAIIAAFERNQGPLAIDYEHGQAHKAAEGELAPAAGWMTAMELRDGALWAKVEWTDKAAAMIAAREYRFTSPEFLVDKQKNVLSVAGAGLVNRPAFVMPALARAEPEESEMDLTAIAKALGLEEDADAATILAAIETRNTETAAVLSALEVENLAAAPEAITALGEEKTRVLAAKDEAAAEIQTLTKRLDDLTAKDRDREIAAAIDQAVKERKIAPASRTHYEKMCEAEGGLERFRELAATLPPIIGAKSELGDLPPETGKLPTDDPQELAARATAYKAEQAKLGRAISTIEAIEELKEKGE